MENCKAYCLLGAKQKKNKHYNEISISQQQQHYTYVFRNRKLNSYEHNIAVVIKKKRKTRE